MTVSSDKVFELFCASNPIDESTVPGPDSPEALTLLERLVSMPPSQPDERTPSRRRLVIAVAVALLTLGLTAATWWAFRDVTDPSSVVCYRGPTLDSDASDAPTGGALEPSLCESGWRDGILTNEDIVPAGQVPPLLGCVTDTGNLAVFPSDDAALCARLGLAPPDPASLSDSEALRELEDSLVDHFSKQDCQSIVAAEKDVRAILDSSGFEHWTIRVMPGDPRDRCASLGYDAPNETVRIIRIPDLG